MKVSNEIKTAAFGTGFGAGTGLGFDGGVLLGSNIRQSFINHQAFRLHSLSELAPHQEGLVLALMIAMPIAFSVIGGAIGSRFERDDADRQQQGRELFTHFEDVRRNLFD